VIKLGIFLPGIDRAGRQEDEVPASDNASKLKKSCENAEHVGKFFPEVRNLPWF
jgi:hypothetical protein